VGVHVEPIVFTVRVLPKGGTYGDPYTLVCTIQKTDDVGFLSACHGHVTVADFNDLKDQMRQYGIKRIVWKRYR
jgi:hypothetical protein